MKRVMIVGQPGAGKSYLGREIGRLTGLPVVHMDMIHWMPGWVERDKTDKLAMVHEVEISDAWVLEGGLSASYAHRLHRADTLIVLDFPLWLRSWRVFARTLRDYGRSREDLPRECPERFSWEFWKWIWDTRHTSRAQNLRLISQAGQVTAVFHLQNRSDVTTFLKTLDAQGFSGQEAAHAAFDYRKTRAQGRRDRL
ncbi:MAG: AAA family ATPase [Pelagimonas sp.]|uniref:AAA family ATPase n=1 Tax=Pelagimonas sp. TaxID=2073170 RepID=UPI003D6A70F6